MKAIKCIAAIIALMTISIFANGAVLWDQGYDSNSYVGLAGSMFLGLSVLEEYAKADDFILDGSLGTTISKVTVYAVDSTRTPDGAPNNFQPIRASVVFLRNDALYPGSGEDINRPENGQCATDAARPLDWAPAGKTSEEIAQWFPFEATASAGGYAGGSGTSWTYKTVVQTDGRGMTATDAGDIGDLTLWQLDIELPTPIILEAGTRYWLAWTASVQANWLPGDFGNNSQMFWTPVKGSPTLAGGWEGNVNNRLWGGGRDFYFILEGEEIPEPATVGILLLGLAGLLFRKKR